MKVLSTLFLGLLLIAVTYGVAPTGRQTFTPNIPMVYIANINGSRVSTLPMTSRIVSNDPLEIALDYVNAVVGSNVQYIVKSAYTTNHNRVHHAYLRQTIKGLEVFNADLNINTWNGKVLSFGHSFHAIKEHPAPAVHSSVDALLAFAKFVGIDVEGAQIGIEATSHSVEKPVHIITGFPKADEVKAKLGYLVLENGAGLEMVWDLEIDVLDHWYSVHVSASDLEVLSLHDWVHDIKTFNAYPIGVNDPSDGSREVLGSPATRTGSPLGWNDQGEGRTFTDTRGNNVFAQENFNGGSSWLNNGRPDGGETLDFNFPIDFTKEPKTYIDAATTNLFFWNNIIHDVFYEYGFDEVSGNFQENNFANGGLGGDAVQANAQDGSGENNANFATPPDGQRPRMRMYTWTQSTPDRDGDLDQGIIIHEYAHGISNRLTGGPSNSNCLGTGEAGGMGEGWGDFFATLLRQRPDYTGSLPLAMGDYSANQAGGIRKYPYTTDFSKNPETYTYVNGAAYTGVHAKGEVWATILYEVYWGLEATNPFNPDWYLGEGANNQLFQDVIDGMKLQPCRPNFVQARDAILQADEVNHQGANVCALWKGFAKRGLGEGAIGTGTGVTKVTESFIVPDSCN